MGDQDTIKRPQKYFFDRHNFDDGRKDEPEEPPPPTFSQEELDAARRDSYDRGKRDGLTEAKTGYEKLTLDVLEKIKQNFSTLFAAEDTRIALYQTETAALAQAIFIRLFPALNDRHGLDEVQQVIASVLDTHRAKPAILIEVCPAHTEAIRVQMDKMAAGLTGLGICTVQPAADLGPGDCRLSWHDGGGTRHAGRLAQEIEGILQQALADRPRLRDNGGDTLESPERESGA